MLIKSPYCYLYFSLTAYKSEVSPALPLVSLNLLERLTELRKVVYSPDYWFIARDIKESDEVMCSTTFGKDVHSSYAL